MRARAGAARGDDRSQLRADGRRPRRPGGAGRGGQRAPLDLGGARPRRRRAGPRADGRRRREGRPGRDLVAQLRGVDADPVRQRQDRRGPGQRQPGLPHPRVRLRGQPERPAAAARRVGVQDQRLPRRWSRRSATSAPTSSGWSTSTPTTGPRWWPAGAAGRRGASPVGWPSLDPHDPINIQYTSGTTGYPKGATLSHRNILNNGYFTTELISFTDAGPAVHPGALLPLLRDGDGQPRLHHPRRHDGDPGAGLRPRDHAAHDRRGALHRACTACRRCSSRCRTTRLRRARPLDAAHRDHGRLDLPGRGDEALRQRHAHDRGVDRLRHDRDLARCPARPAPTTTSSGVPPPSAGCTRTSRSRSSTR